MRGCEVDTSKLGKKERESLESLVAGGHLSLSSKGARDLTTYEITVLESERKIDFSFDELTIPESGLPFLDWLIKKSKPVKP
jgi:hypothetical protein